MQPSPIVTPGKIVALVPIHTPLPTTTGFETDPCDRRAGPPISWDPVQIIVCMPIETPDPMRTCAALSIKQSQLRKVSAPIRTSRPPKKQPGRMQTPGATSMPRSRSARQRSWNGTRTDAITRLTTRSCQVRLIVTRSISQQHIAADDPAAARASDCLAQELARYYAGRKS
jgi:hypothetical protein